MNATLRVLVLTGTILLLGWGAHAWAQPVPHIFAPGQPAKSADVNDNFAALAAAIGAPSPSTTPVQLSTYQLSPAQAGTPVTSRSATVTQNNPTGQTCFTGSASVYFSGTTPTTANFVSCDDPGYTVVVAYANTQPEQMSCCQSSAGTPGPQLSPTPLYIQHVVYVIGFCTIFTTGTAPTSCTPPSTYSTCTYGASGGPYAGNGTACGGWVGLDDMLGSATSDFAVFYENQFQFTVSAGTVVRTTGTTTDINRYSPTALCGGVATNTTPTVYYGVFKICVSEVYNTYLNTNQTYNPGFLFAEPLACPSGCQQTSFPIGSMTFGNVIVGQASIPSCSLYDMPSSGLHNLNSYGCSIYSNTYVLANGVGVIASSFTSSYSPVLKYVQINGAPITGAAKPAPFTAALSGVWF